MRKFSGIFSAAAVALLLTGCGDPGEMDDEAMQDMQQQQQQEGMGDQQQQEGMDGMGGQQQEGGYEFEDQEDDRDQGGDW